MRFCMKKIKEIACLASTLLMYRGFKGPKINPDLNVTQRSNNNHGVKLITLTTILGTVFLLFKGWFNKLPKLKKVITITLLSLIIVSLLFGMFPVISILIKLIICVLTGLMAVLNTVNKYLLKVQ